MTNEARSLHAWLCLNSDRLLKELWRDLETCQRILPAAYRHLPATREALIEGLEELEKDGLSRGDGDRGDDKQDDVRWFYKAEKVKAEPQRQLF